jgi:hypothetical protein
MTTLELGKDGRRLSFRLTLFRYSLQIYAAAIFRANCQFGTVQI